MFCSGERGSRLDLLGGELFLCLEDADGERRFAGGELLCFGGGERETLSFGCGEGEALLLGGDAVRLFGGGEGEYLLCMGGEYLLGVGECRRGGGEGDLRSKKAHKHIDQITKLEGLLPRQITERKDKNTVK